MEGTRGGPCGVPPPPISPLSWRRWGAVSFGGFLAPRRAGFKVGSGAWPAGDSGVCNPCSFWLSRLVCSPPTGRCLPRRPERLAAPAATACGVRGGARPGEEGGRAGASPGGAAGLRAGVRPGLAPGAARAPASAPQRPGAPLAPTPALRPGLGAWQVPAPRAHRALVFIPREFNTNELWVGPRKHNV